MWKEATELSDFEFALEEQEDVSKKNKRKEKNILKEEEEKYCLPSLPENIIFDILARIPASYLHCKFRYICKAWDNIISSSKFIAQNAIQNKHNQLLVQIPTSTKQHYYKAKLLEMEEMELDFKLHCFDMRRMGRIRSSCNGLLLIHDPKQKGVLYVMNLLTKCVVTLPKCPSRCPHKACGSTLGFSRSTREYKVVHMYSDVFGYEIFTLGCSDNEWKRIPGPFKEPYDRPFCLDFNWGDPVKINDQFLHWYVSSSQFIISMDVTDENSRKTYLPDCSEEIDKSKYALLEMGGYLSLVYKVSGIQIDVWILRDFQAQVWFKKHSIITESINYTNLKDSSLPSKYKNALPDLNKLVPLASLRNGEGDNV
ncbi:hypothetical protein L1049_007920 [Liquidambar formosana]|uniref:F-box domain-containing protein n=1 Tax=Liquidambar formosana TaxID=63359 RepID=A0AAP0S272_LIQFO